MVWYHGTHGNARSNNISSIQTVVAEQLRVHSIDLLMLHYNLWNLSRTGQASGGQRTEAGPFRALHPARSRIMMRPKADLVIFL